ncbi:unnamed protein product [Brassicogethes aeneus]|uniref:limulus clotting factor C n=1 Tax=Brassicogethes aeneus TaxID=1431903 RepID=A0A9P0B976_BRAAE|nr:unnamed protein product [Brassicogethes aeneus]
MWSLVLVVVLVGGTNSYLDKPPTIDFQAPNNQSVIIIDSKTFKQYNRYEDKPKATQTVSSNGTLPVFSSWSAWSRCMNCMQRRIRTCVKPSLCELNSRTYEERTCNSSRCKRKLWKREDFRIVHLNKKSNHFLKQAPTDTWSKWLDWTPCSEKCKTSRIRICRKPGRCQKEQQMQNAFCYFKGSYCEKYVLNLIDNNQKYPDNRRYEYSNNTEPVNRKSKTRCGRPYKKSKMLRIIGGREAQRHKWPWHVAVLNKYLEVFCGGTLIAPRWVLTASHCIRSFLRVRLNEFDLTADDGRELEMKVSKVFPHPRFNHQTVDNDIALLLLPRAVKIPVACLPRRKPRAGELCSVMGWGKVNTYHRYGSTILNEAKLPIIPTHTCRKSYKQILITENMLCAGWTSGKQDTCAGDSGGGLMCPVRKKKKIYKVNGITSFGDGCGRIKKYGIYTSVYNYVPWIDHIIEMYS